MPNDEPSLLEVKFTDEFQRRLRALAKKYRQIRLDIQPIIEQLQAGNFVGDRLTGLAIRFLKYEFVTVISKRAKVLIIV